MIYKLKTAPEQFRAILAGGATYVLPPDDDRTCAVGDVLVLREHHPAPPHIVTPGGNPPPGFGYTGRQCWVVVTHTPHRAPAHVTVPVLGLTLDAARAKLWTRRDSSSPVPIHHLKTWASHFQAVCDGRKPYELRMEDVRRFAPGDILALQEYIPTDMDLFDVEPSWTPDAGGYYTGHTCWVAVIDEPLRDTRWLQPGVAALPIRRLRVNRPGVSENQPLPWAEPESWPGQAIAFAPATNAQDASQEVSS